MLYFLLCMHALAVHLTLIYNIYWDGMMIGGYLLNMVCQVHAIDVLSKTSLAIYFHVISLNQ